MYKASYTTRIVKENTTIQRDKFSCIAFYNIGQSPIRVNDIIIPSSAEISFNEDPGVIINTDFLIEFIPVNPGDTQLVDCVMTFYKEFNDESL